MNQQELRQTVATFLAGCRTLSLATADKAGRPHAANLQFAADEEFNLYFVSAPDSLHSVNLATRREVALTIYDHQDQEPAGIRGLQMTGICQPLRIGAEKGRADQLYREKFAFLKDHPELEAVLGRMTMYRIQPMWIRWIDNRRGFGFKAELEIEGEPPKA
ncbi:MAG: pyridoxamine 5'-phosphate oxidase family protein [Phycisphaeraceae bacterium]|nr:pyridoxamine 5'-phosphate oxidase family protein [Phycisphaeraceae bacterium]